MIEIITGIITPVFGVLVLGFCAARFGWFDADGVRGLSLFVFNFVIPPLLFHNMLHAELPAQIPWRLVMTYYLSTMLIFAFAMWLGRVVLPALRALNHRRDRVFKAHVQASFITATEVASVSLPRILSAAVFGPDIVLNLLAGRNYGL